MTRIRNQAIAWRLGLARLAASMILPPYSLRRVRAIIWRFGGARITPGVEIAGGTDIVAVPNVSIGRGSFVGARVLLVATADAAIEIGRNVSIGPGVCIATPTHDIGVQLRRAGRAHARPVAIGDGVWLGARATILPGVTIGTGSVVAAGAVVTRDVGPDLLVAGIPARVVRSL